MIIKEAYPLFSFCIYMINLPQQKLENPHSKSNPTTIITYHKSHYFTAWKLLFSLIPSNMIQIQKKIKIDFMQQPTWRLSNKAQDTIYKIAQITQQFTI